MAIPMTWTQTATLVKVTLATGGIGIDDVEVEWSESDCTVDIRDGRHWHVSWFAPIVQERSYVKKTSSHVKLYLVKADENVTWPFLEGPVVQELPHVFTRWDDQADFVRLTLAIYFVDPSSLEVDFSPDSVFMTFQTQDPFYNNEVYPDADYVSWEVELDHRLDFLKSWYHVADKSIELVLVKETANVPWPKPDALLSSAEQDIIDKHFDVMTDAAKETSLLEEESRRLRQRIQKRQEEFDNAVVDMVKSISELDQIKIEETPYAPPTPTPTPTPTPLVDSKKMRLVPRGIRNPGNTCFLSSVVQCLAHCVELTSYMLDGYYVRDVNEENPLGYKGQLARAFARSLEKMWSTDFHRDSVSPKILLTAFQSKMDGYAQHDAQEYMSFLIDGLHEDLNRVKSKPLTSPIEAKGRPDHEVAEEAWQVHKLRNDSIIADLFGGQFKSTVTCKKCQNVSTTFDPFFHISVPLPKEETPLQAVYMSKDPTKELLLLVLKLPGEPEYNDLYAAVLARQHDLNIKSEQSLIAYVVLNGLINRVIFQSDTSMKYVDFTDRFVVSEVDVRSRNGEETILVAVYQRLAYLPMPTKCAKCWKKNVDLKRCAKCYQVAYCSQSCQKLHWTHGKHRSKCGILYQYIGLPFILSLHPREATFSRISELAQAHAKRTVDVRSKASVDVDVKLYRVNIDGLPFQKEKEEIKDLGSEPVLSSGESFYFVALEWQNDRDDTDSVIVTEKKDMTYGVDETQLPQHREAVVTGKYSLTLKHCFDLFTKQEELDANDTCYCSKCKEHCEASKRLSIWRLPRILVVQLKRFSYTGDILRDKIYTKVTFPINDLDLEPYIARREEGRNCTYELFGVAYHVGATFGGHYTAAARLGDGDWHWFDDDYVRKCFSERELLRSQAYVLFYRRRERAD
ncbi:ubiquitin carboxyl-terminal hydrolase 19-like [Oscarella lobularis]|uniref:ubiquitin carboxyl-terminal hydrolase 19-like n=1 Tax=Oscarella lobularis TaxID=121494 RepID=UPI0033140888